jgi:hypothetical protein
MRIQRKIGRKEGQKQRKPVRQRRVLPNAISLNAVLLNFINL